MNSFDKKLPLLLSKEDYTRKGIIARGFNQDTITSAAFWLAGYTRLQTVVNRVIHIGQIGISNPIPTKADRKENHMSLDEFDADPSITEFKLMDESASFIERINSYFIVLWIGDNTPSVRRNA